MRNLMYQCRGAISVFLIIVLVPMLTCASLLVDLSRIRLAESVAASSGDLALNTALTNYDAVLKNMYGLFATSQNSEELFNNLEDYYRQSIEAAGVAEADAEDYVGQIMQYLKSATGTDDMLNMNLVSFEVKTEEGGNLANPAILKAQIVDFMKYRAPLNLGTGIFEAFSSLKNLEKQTALVENKSKFYEQQTSMMESLEAVWSLLEDYQYRDAKIDGGTNGFPQGNYLSKASQELEERAVDLKDAMEGLAKYLYYAQSTYYDLGIGNYVITCTDTDEGEDWYVPYTGKTWEVVDEYDRDNKADTIIDYLHDVSNTLKKVKEYQSQWKPIDPNNASDREKIAAVVTFNETLGTKYHEAMAKLVYQLYLLQNAFNGISKEKLADYHVVYDKSTGTYKVHEIDENTSTSRVSLESFIQDQLTTHLTDAANSHIGLYNEHVARILKCWTDTHEKVSEARGELDLALKGVKTEITQIRTLITEKRTKISSAITDLNKIKSDLERSDSDYKEALDEWKKSSDGLAGDPLGDSDKSEIERLSKVLNKDNVGTLITRLEEADACLKEIQNTLDRYSVFGKNWKDLSSVEDLIAQLNKMSNITTLLDKAKESDYGQIIKAMKATVQTPGLPTTFDDNKSPDLTKEQSNLYTWLYNNFAPSNVESKYDSYKWGGRPTTTATNSSSQIADNKDNANDEQKKIEAAAKAYNEKSDPPTSTQVPKEDRPYDKEFLPSGEWDGTLKNIEASGEPSSDSDAALSGSSGTMGMFTKVFELIEKMGTTLRDDLYIANYIMNMFSYSTYESEITTKNGEKFEGAWYQYNETEKKYELKEPSKMTEQMVKDAQTLTNVSINPNANYLYGKEIEYIIYGGADLNGDKVIDEKDNPLVASYGTIYAIRFALNTVYAFMDAEISNITTATATALFGVPPLTPLIPVAKIAMTIAFALAESAWDLYQLKSGESVPLMKNAQTFVMKPTNALKAAAGTLLEKGTDIVIDKGLEVLNQALDMTDEELEAFINTKVDGAKTNLDKLVDSAWESTLGEITNYGNQVVQEVVDLCNEIVYATDWAKKTAVDRIEYVSSEVAARLQEWLKEQEQKDSGYIYEAKRIAVEYLIAPVSAYDPTPSVLKEIVTTLDAIAQEANKAQEKIQEMQEELQVMLDDIKDQILSQIRKLADTAGDALNDLKSKTIAELKDAAKEGADSLKDALKSKIGATFGTSSSSSTSAQTGTASVMSSLLSWHYSDYLQLLLIVGLVASPESILLRTADVIELNMQRLNGNLGFVETQVTYEETVSRLWGLIKYKKLVTKTEHVANANAFKLNKSYTYLGIKAVIEVKPMMVAIPLIENTVESELTGTKWYEITYEGTAGY